MGPADSHCALPDGGSIVQMVDLNACQPAQDAAGGGDDGGGGPPMCPFGSTMFSPQATRVEADDDDCKYHLTVTPLSPLCAGPNVTFQLVATVLADGTTVGSVAAGTGGADDDRGFAPVIRNGRRPVRRVTVVCRGQWTSSLRHRNRTVQ